MKPLIYALRDPRDGRIRYVGYSKNFAARLHYHYRDRRHSVSKRIQCLAQPWLFELAENAITPVSECLEWLSTDSDWEERERYWIAHFKNLGEPLLNGTSGGMGTDVGNWDRVSPERRAEWARNISEGTKRTWHQRSPENKDKALAILAANRKPWSYKYEKEQKTKSQLASEKRWSDPDQKAKHTVRMKSLWAKWRVDHGMTGTWDERRKQGLT